MRRIFLFDENSLNSSSTIDPSSASASTIDPSSASASTIDPSSASASTIDTSSASASTIDTSSASASTIDTSSASASTIDTSFASQCTNFSSGQASGTQDAYAGIFEDHPGLNPNDERVVELQCVIREKCEALTQDPESGLILAEALHAESDNVAFLQFIADDLTQNGVSGEAFQEALNIVGQAAASPLDQFEIVPLIPMHIGNFYFSFTNPSLFMLLTLSFFLLLILVFVLWILVRALWHFPLAVIHMMVNSSTLTSSSSSSSNNKRRDKRKKKEDLITNLVVEEVEKYLTRHRQSIMQEFPRAFPYMETSQFLTEVSTDLLRGAGLLNSADPERMELLHMIHRNFVDAFEMVKEEGYRNNVIYYSVRSFLKHYRSR